MASYLAKGLSFFLASRAKQEVSSLGEDINAMGEGTTWFFNKLRGKMQRSLPELLKAYELPQGLFPRNLTHYEYDEETGVLTVYMPYICEVGFKDMSVIKYDKQVTGVLAKGKLTDIQGMKTKLFIWVKITSISAEVGSGKLYITAGVKKSKPLDTCEVLRDGIQVDTF